MYRWGMGACPSGMTYTATWTPGVNAGNTYPAQTDAPGMCLAPVPTCGKCQTSVFSLNSDGTSSPSCQAFPDADTLARLKQLQANPSKLLPNGMTLEAYLSLMSQAAPPVVPNVLDCLNAALGISTGSTSTSSASWFTETSVGSIPNWALLLGGLAAVWFLAKGI